ncbi:hypothetical protein QFZ60_002357 [Arthrobacter sp. B2I5]|nr:hypothetical protein [Arthrobacter sp. B2I5]
MTFRGYALLQYKLASDGPEFGTRHLAQNPLAGLSQQTCPEQGLSPRSCCWGRALEVSGDKCRRHGPLRGCRSNRCRPPPPFYHCLAHWPGAPFHVAKPWLEFLQTERLRAGCFRAPVPTGPGPIRSGRVPSAECVFPVETARWSAPGLAPSIGAAAIHARCAGRRRRCSPIYSSWSVLAYKRSPSPSSLTRTCVSISCSTDWAIPFLRLLNQLPSLLFRPTLGVLTPENPVDGPRSRAPLRAARILGYSAASETGANCQCAGPPRIGHRTGGRSNEQLRIL